MLPRLESIKRDADWLLTKRFDDDFWECAYNTLLAANRWPVPSSHIRRGEMREMVIVAREMGHRFVAHFHTWRYLRQQRWSIKRWHYRQRATEAWRQGGGK